MKWIIFPTCDKHVTCIFRSFSLDFRIRPDAYCTVNLSSFFPFLPPFVGRRGLFCSSIGLFSLVGFICLVRSQATPPSTLANHVCFTCVSPISVAHTYNEQDGQLYYR